jgi:hypothetical protein
MPENSVRKPEDGNFLTPYTISLFARCRIASVDGHWRNHLYNGWQTVETFQKSLVELQCTLRPGPFHWLLDSYSAERIGKITTMAAGLDVTLHCFLPSLTDEFEPLSWAIFGVVKAQAKPLFHARSQANHDGRQVKSRLSQT